MTDYKMMTNTTPGSSYRTPFQSLVAQRLGAPNRPTFRISALSATSAEGTTPIAAVNAEHIKIDITHALSRMSFNTVPGSTAHEDEFNINTAVDAALDTEHSVYSSMYSKLPNDTDPIYKQLSAAIDNIFTYAASRDMITVAAETTAAATTATIDEAITKAINDDDIDYAAQPLKLRKRLFLAFKAWKTLTHVTKLASTAPHVPNYSRIIMEAMQDKHPNDKPLAGVLMELSKLIRASVHNVTDAIGIEHDKLLTAAIGTTHTAIDTKIDEANRILNGATKSIAALTSRLNQVQEEAASMAGDVVVANDCERLYDTSMGELCELAKMMAKYENAANVYKAKHDEIQEIELLDIDPDDLDKMLDAVNTTTPLKSKLQILADKITAVETSIVSLYKRIRTVLTTHCNIPERVRQELTLSTTTIKLPEKLATGKPDPLVAEELQTVVLKLMCTYPDQLWAIIPALSRLITEDFTDVSNTTAWYPPALSNDMNVPHYADVPTELIVFFASHNKRLYDTLLNISRQAVQRSLSTFSTGDDSASQRRTTRAMKDDGISVIMWHIHFHEQSGYQIRCELASYLSYAHGAFSDGDPIHKVAAVRKRVVQAMRLKIKIEYDMTIRRIAEVLRRRDVAFQAPMSAWMSCTDVTYQSDCIGLFDPFLAEIERAARNVADVLPALDDKNNKQARALFAQFSNTIDGSLDDMPDQASWADQLESESADDHAYAAEYDGKRRPTSAGEPSTKWVCPVKDCGKPISAEGQAAHMERIKKAKANNRRCAQMLCSGCLMRLKDDGSITYETGAVRKWHDNKTRTANVAGVEKASQKAPKKATEPASDDVEERFARMIDQRFAQMASDIKSVREADEPAPEPAPESFSMQLAKAMVSKGAK